MDNMKSAVASAAVTSPWWLTALHNWSQTAAEVVPILGAIYLAVQIVQKLFEIGKGKPKDDKE